MELISEMATQGAPFGLSPQLMAAYCFLLSDTTIGRKRQVLSLVNARDWPFQGDFHELSNMGLIRPMSTTGPTTYVVAEIVEESDSYRFLAQKTMNWELLSAMYGVNLSEKGRLAQLYNTFSIKPEVSTYAAIFSAVYQTISGLSFPRSFMAKERGQLSHLIRLYEPAVLLGITFQYIYASDTYHRDHYDCTVGGLLAYKDKVHRDYQLKISSIKPASHASKSRKNESF